MSTAQTLLLGAIAGGTIFVGLPVARMRNVSANVRSMLAATATGILIFLLWDVLANAVEPVEEALTNGRDGRFLWLSALLTVGFAAGLLVLVYYDGWMKARRRKAFLLGPGAAAPAEFETYHFAGLSPARWLAVFIATGIALHNATEGFGICAPLSGETELPSWRFLALMGLIGGGPTFVGTAVGQAWVSEAISVLFLALAGGSILYVVIELLTVLRGAGSKAM